jgi:hypothetical protein
MVCSRKPFYQCGVQKMEKILILVHGTLQCPWLYRGRSRCSNLEAAAVLSAALDGAERFIGGASGCQVRSDPSKGFTDFP